MKFKSSPKIYKNYKSDYPENTVSNIKKYLKSIGLQLKYNETKITFKNKSIYIGNLSYNKNIAIKNTPLSWGKGNNKKLCRAATYAELIERIFANASILSPFLKINFRNKEINKNNDKIKIEKFIKYFPNFNKRNNFSKDYLESFSLLKNKKINIPYSFIRYISSTNGLAAGNTSEEAVSQGFCEVCERYSLVEHLIKRISAPTIDQKTIKSKKIINLINLYNSLNIEVEIKDFTLKNKVPVMGVLFTNNNVKKRGELIKKVHFKSLIAGAHFNLEEAIIRCFTEMFQKKRDIYNPGIIEIYQKNKTFQIDVISKYYTKKEEKKIIKILKKKHYIPLFISGLTLDNLDFLKKTKNKRFSELKSIKTKDFLEDINLIKDISLKNNWEVLIVDHSIKECPIKVIRTIIPSVSDVLRYRYKKNENINDNFKNCIDVDKKSIANLNHLQKLNFFKFAILPEITIPYPVRSSIKKYNQINVIKNILEAAIIIKNKKEIKKINNLFENIDLTKIK